MIAVIFSWIAVIIVFLSFGKMFVLLSEKITGLRADYTLIDLFFTGLCTVGMIICITSLFLPSGGNILFFLLFVSILFLLIAKKSRHEIFERCKRKVIELNKIQYTFIGIVILLLLSFVVMPPQLPDSFYYHVQNIMWNEEYRVVPGLANLIEQFGFNSNFFLLSSVFGLKPLFGQFVYGLNALSYGLLIIYFITSYQKTIHSRIIIFIGIFICFLYFLVYKIHIGSPSTDMLPNILIIYLLFTVLDNPEHIKKKWLMFCVIPVFCVTLKLSSIFLCLLTFYLVIWLIRNKSFKVLSYLSIVSLIIIVPWLIRNVLVSGYLIYPFPAIDIFDVDWKMPLQYVIASKKYVEAYAISVDAMHYSSDFVLNLPFAEKLSRWLSEQPVYELGAVFLALLSPFLMFFAYRLYKNNEKISSIVWWAWTIAFLGFGFGLVMAPAIRFGFGFIVMAAGIPVYYILKGIRFPNHIFSSKMLILFSLTLLLITGILTARYFMVVNDPNKSVFHILYKPLGLDSTRPGRELKITEVKVNDLQINRPNGLAMDGLLPCSSVYIDNIEMRGQSLQNGFKIKNN